MKNEVKTLQLLSRPKTSGDLWDELNRDINPYMYLINFAIDEQFHIRLLGTFLQVRRLYIPDTKLFDKFGLDATNILNTKSSVIRKVCERIDAFRQKQGLKLEWKHPQSELDEFYIFLQKLEGSHRWQSCVMVNALLFSHTESQNRLKIVTLTRRLCESIFNRTRGDTNVKISGLNAHNLFITRRGQGLNTKFEVGFSKKPTFLSEEHLEYVFSHGLLDIPAVIEKLQGRYLYKIESGYKMPDKFNNVLFEEIKNQEEDRQIEEVEKHIDELPLTAFENYNQMRGSINSLEID